MAAWHVSLCRSRFVWIKESQCVCTIEKKRISKASDYASTSINESVGVQGQNLINADKSTRNIFNSAEKDRFDNHTRFFGKALTRQSDRNLPRCYFPGGITGDKKKNGFEMQGVVLNILCVFYLRSMKNSLTFSAGTSLVNDVWATGFWSSSGSLW